MTEEKKEVAPKVEPEVKKEPAKKAAPKKAAPKKAATKAAPKKKKRSVVKPVKRFSFEQWAARRGVKEHHRGGLRAFVKNPNKYRTLEEWDKCFVGY